MSNLLAIKGAVTRPIAREILERVYDALLLDPELMDHPFNWEARASVVKCMYYLPGPLTRAEIERITHSTTPTLEMVTPAMADGEGP